MDKDQVIDLAVTKLVGGHVPQWAPSDALLVALDSRVLIGFDPVRSCSLTKQTKLIKSFMRCIFNIPKSRECVYSGYPSEPILSEAAGRILNPYRRKDESSIKNSAPEILGEALLLAKGERGELVARTLLTVAHDLAAEEMDQSQTSEPLFHRPIRLIDFLRKLLAPEIWERVRHAKPNHEYEDANELEVAFPDTWINFSHFICLDDYESFSVECATENLKRGAAIQGCDGQENQDLGIPLHNGDPTLMNICPEKTSIVQFQVKNGRKAVTVFPDPNLIGLRGDDLSILSVVMQLGVEMPQGSQFKIDTTRKNIDAPAGNTRGNARADPTNIARRHYSIALYGCTGSTYSCVGPHGPTYQSLLRTKPKPFHDFPRDPGDPVFLDAVYNLKPTYKTASRMGWQL